MPGRSARHRETISRVSARLAEASPRMLESICKSFMALSHSGAAQLGGYYDGRRLIPETIGENPPKMGLIVPFLEPIETRSAASRGLLLLQSGRRAWRLCPGGARPGNSQVAC